MKSENHFKLKINFFSYFTNFSCNFYLITITKWYFNRGSHSRDSGCATFLCILFIYFEIQLCYDQKIATESGT